MTISEPLHTSIVNARSLPEIFRSRVALTPHAVAYMFSPDI